MTPDPLIACSEITPTRSHGTSIMDRTLGRTEVGLMEALEPPAAVPIFPPAFISRPGPACGMGERVFQTQTSGKYANVVHPMFPDPSVTCSQSPTPGSAIVNQLHSDEVVLPSVLPLSILNDRPGTSYGTTHTSATFNRLPQTVRHSHSSGVSIYYQNVRGLRTKTEDFYTAVTASPYDVFVITETWLDEVIPSSMLFSNDYAVYRGDRTPLTSTKNRSGGVLVAVKNTIPSKQIPNSEDRIEHVWVSLSLSRCKLVVGAIYIPPEKASDVLLTNRHIDCLQSVISSSDHDAVAVFGDYNRAGLHWIRSDDNRCNVDIEVSSLTQSNMALLEGMSSNNMWQLNCLENRAGNTLDLLFVNEEMVNGVTIDEVDDPLLPIDPPHPPFACILEDYEPLLEYDEDDIDINALNFRKADFNELCVYLSRVDWSPVTEGANLDDAVDSFTSTLLRAFALFVPCQRPPKKPPWSNAELRQMKRNSKSAQKVYRKNRTAANKLSFKFASRQYRSLNHRLYRRHVAFTERNLKQNPKGFWSFVKSKRKQSGLPSAMHLDERHANTSLGKCELFASFFSSMFDSSSGNVEAALELTPADCVDVDIFVVSSEDMEKAVKKLKSSYQPGPDGIASCVLKKCFQQLLLPLTHLYNLSLRSASFPTRWKSSFMFPVHKKGSKNDVRCYRGITSLCACSKLFEIIVSEHVLRRTKHYISVNQHGFFPGRSVVTNLCEFTSFCLLNIEQGRQIDAIYTDLKAAFDKVDHSILLAKLGKLGCSSRLVEWLGSYLCNRKLAIKIGCSVSNWFDGSSGVPQGSNLGPLLFSLFVNDAIVYLGAGCCLVYADDVKLYFLVNKIEDCRLLQALLNRFVTWCEANRMQLSVPKCCVISFHRKTNFLAFDYAIGAEPLNRVETIRDLGVTLDTAVSFDKHYDDIIEKACRQLGFVSKVSKEFRDPYTLKSLYVSLVRPLLETASIVWDPYQVTVTDRIEAVQRRFVRFALRNLPWNNPRELPPYENRCQLIGLETLEQRRKRAKAMFVAKLIVAEVDAPHLLEKVNINVPGYALRRSEFLRLPFRRRDYSSNEPVRSMMECFNDVVHLFDFNITTNEFKNRLKRFMFN